MNWEEGKYQFFFHSGTIFDLSVEMFGYNPRRSPKSKDERFGTNSSANVVAVNAQVRHTTPFVPVQSEQKGRTYSPGIGGCLSDGGMGNAEDRPAQCLCSRSRNYYLVVDSKVL